MYIQSTWDLPEILPIVILSALRINWSVVYLFDVELVCCFTGLSLTCLSFYWSVVILFVV